MFCMRLCLYVTTHITCVNEPDMFCMSMTHVCMSTCTCNISFVRRKSETGGGQSNSNRLDLERNRDRQRETARSCEICINTYQVSVSSADFGLGGCFRVVPNTPSPSPETSAPYLVVSNIYPYTYGLIHTHIHTHKHTRKNYLFVQ